MHSVSPPSHSCSRRWLSRRAVLAGLALALLCGACWVALRPVRTKRTEVVVAPDVLRQSLTLREGHWYRIGETNPFTGSMADYYPNGAPLFRSAVSNGLLNGV